MESVNTIHPTKVYRDYIVDPSMMEKIVEKSGKKRSVTFKDYRYDNSDHNHKFIKEVCSEFLELNGFNHNKEKIAVIMLIRLVFMKKGTLFHMSS